MLHEGSFIKKDKTILVAISGASGSIYGIRLVEILVQLEFHIVLIISDGARQVLFHEMGIKKDESFRDFLIRYGINLSGATLDILSQHDIEAAPASGSFIHRGMIIAPCSMKTLAAVAFGYADNLIIRAADVCLKESRPLILVPRETPYGIIHLENMIRIARAGGVILPPNPSFYTCPKNINQLVDTVVARVLDQLSISHNLIKRWQA